MNPASEVQSALDFGDGFDFTEPGLLARGLPVEQFARLRRSSPVWWNAQDSSNGGGFHDGGYWAISKHTHIREISRDPETWSSNLNGCIMRYKNDISGEEIDAAKAMMHNSDPPSHTRLRKLISRLFTPRNVANLKDNLTNAAREIVATAAEKSECDFVQEVAHKLPLKAIADLVGFPDSDHQQLFDWTNIIVSAEDPNNPGDPVLAMTQLMGYSYELAAERKKDPADDIISRLVMAGDDGDQLSEIEFGYFMLLLVIAGNETTRNATSAGMAALLDHPDQWDLFKSLRPTTTADEIIRWASPVNVFQRTARRDTRIGGVQIRSGQRVGLFYGSGNYDEDVFVKPFEFDILRDPNPHLGFGGNGPHFCIGANLARMEVNIMLNAIADVMPDIELTAEPTRMHHGWINGIASMPVRFNVR